MDDNALQYSGPTAGEVGDFTRFCYLPPELRFRIWYFASTQPQLIHLTIKQKSRQAGYVDNSPNELCSYHLVCVNSNRLNRIHEVNREAREICLRHTDAPLGQSHRYRTADPSQDAYMLERLFSPTADWLVEQGEWHVADGEEVETLDNQDWWPMLINASRIVLSIDEIRSDLATYGCSGLFLILTACVPVWILVKDSTAAMGRMFANDLDIVPMPTISTSCPCHVTPTSVTRNSIPS